jgi:hypothetical protein
MSARKRKRVSTQVDANDGKPSDDAKDPAAVEVIQSRLAAMESIICELRSEMQYLRYSL